MRPAERIPLIKKLATGLEGMDWGELDLTLRQFGLPWSPNWDGDKRSYVLSHLEDGGDAVLRALEQYLYPDGGIDISIPSEGPWETSFFKLFMTHTSGHKRFVGNVKGALSKYGIDGFVAHQDIEPTQEWIEVIDVALRTCDALAAFLAPGFRKSAWTDQEVGYVVARRALIIPVNRGITPYGFIARYQALDVRAAEAPRVASAIFEVLIAHDLTSGRMAESLVNRLAESDSFRMSIDIMRLIKDHVDVWTPAMLRTMEQSIEKNRQVRDAFGVPEAIRAIVKRESQ